MQTVSFATSRRGGLTTDEIHEIEAHRNRDRPTPWQALAARFGRPVATIQAVIYAPRPTGHVRTDDDAPPPLPHNTRVSDRITKHEQRVTALWKAGVGVNAICNTLSISQTTLNVIRKRLGLKLRAVGNQGLVWTEEMDAVVRLDYIIGGKSASTVSKALGVSRGALLGRVHRLGLSKHCPLDRLAG
jgi:DNA-binding CsgD family transcriptional regulator